MKLRLKTRYVLSLLSVIISVVFILSGTLLFEFRHSVQSLVSSSTGLMDADLFTQLKYRGSSLSQFLARELALPIFRLDYKAMFQILKLAREQNEVAYVYVYDRDGTIIHDGTSPIPINLGQMNDEFGLKALDAESPLLESSGTILHAACPATLGGAPVGGVRLGLDIAGISRDIANVRTQMEVINQSGMRSNMYSILLIALGLCLFGAVLAVWLSHNLSRPIVQLAEMASRIGHGDYQVDPVINRTDEIGNLAFSFKTMADNLNRTTVSKAYVDNIVSQMNDTLAVVSLDGTIQKVNRALLHLLGYQEEELIGRQFSALLVDEPMKRSWLEKVLADGQMTGVDIEYADKTGKKVPVQFSAGLMRNGHGEPQAIICAAQDVTQLKKHQKLAAIGQLAASVAHELRNPLGSIQNSLYYLKESLAPTDVAKSDPTIGEFINLASEEIKRSNRIIGELLDYSRELKLNLESIDVGSFIEDITSSLEVPANIKLIFAKEENLPRVALDAQKFHQVATNLMMNAFQAMPQGGQLHIACQRETDEAGVLWVRVDFKDTGVGISEENLRHLFEPLFTTKLKGTGLGLAICQQIVKGHGGKISMSSKLGHGTTMMVHLPAEKPAEQAA